MRIVIAAGSSGGHIFPAIATTSRLKELNDRSEIFFMGSSKSIDKKIFEGHNCDYYRISSRRRPLADLAASFLMLRKFKPDAVVGFGGYVSFPVLLAAKMLRIPTIAHEQNIFPGLANRVLSNFVDKMAVSFSCTAKFIFKKSIIRETGNPVRSTLIRSEKADAIEKLGLNKGKFSILIMGGSQGAHFINNAVVGMFGQMDGARKNRLQCIHLSGGEDLEFVRSGYGSAGIESRVFAFFDEMSLAYSAADMIISRAGATSISEITFFGKPAVLIPYPGKKVHQMENAEFLEKNNAALVVEQAGFSEEALKNAVVDLMDYPEKCRVMSANSACLAQPDASHKLAVEILKTVLERK